MDRWARGRRLIARRAIQRKYQSHHGHETHGDPAEPASALTTPRVIDYPEPDAGERCGHEASMNSTMGLVKVDRRASPQLHEQVAAQIRRAVADGEAMPGERLPPARDLAAVTGVNTNTVLRALRQLRDEGLLEFRRGRGVRVVGTPGHGSVLEMAVELVDVGRRHGYGREELLRMIRSVP